MVELSALWLPILLSAIGVFFASSLVHMVLPLHHADYDRPADEDAILDLVRAQNLGKGDYIAPYAVTAEQRKDEAVQAKIARGPMVFMTVIPKVAMGASLVQWLIYCLVIGLLVAVVLAHTTPGGVDAMHVFLLATLVAFLAYGAGDAQQSIWMGRKWSSTARHTLDGLIYGLVTGGIFAWLWPA